MGDRRGKTRVAGGNGEDVTAGDRESPYRELVAGNAGEGRSEPGRGLPVGELIADPHELPWHAAAFTEVSVVEGKHRVAGVMESSSEAVGTGFFDDAQPGGHDHACAVHAGVVPGRAAAPGASEVDFPALGGHRHCSTDWISS